ncbi:transposase [Brevibacillus laterosporus]|uniref:Transposase n=1 Tax=Brevibacillus laterosporus TaxID=1465 RepID=A0A518VAS4_BRELA|nr:transposase [Brevibacillus laterosporus]
MSEYDRSAHLKAIHAKRKANTYLRVDEAIKRLIKANEKINFNSVSSEADVSKATLYNNKEFRSRIETLRSQQSQVSTSKQLKREMNESNKDALIASLKRKNKKLEEENRQLREQLKVAYADVYKRL